MNQYNHYGDDDHGGDDDDDYDNDDGDDDDGDTSSYRRADPDLQMYIVTQCWKMLSICTSVDAVAHFDAYSS